MKTVIRKDTRISLYLLPDSTVVLLGDDQMQVGADPIEFFVSDCNASSAIVCENVTPPSDWVACKYLYDAGAWTLNPAWVEPEQS